MNSHSNYYLRLIGRLRPEVSREQALSDLNAISKAIISEFPINQGTAIDIFPLREVIAGGDVRRALFVLLGAVAFVLLIACANLANLLLARAAVRQREIAVRLALGASTGRLLRQFLAESLLLSLAGGGLGLLIAYLSADALNAMSQRVLPRAADIAVDPTVLAFTFTIATVTGVVLGLAPAVHAAGASVNAGLKDGTRSVSDSARHSRLRIGLVIAEVAFSLVLLAGAGLMVKSMYQLLHVASGFDPSAVLTMQISLPAGKYVDRELERKFAPEAYVRANTFFKDVVGRVRTLPGVQAVGAINGLPLMGEVWGKNVTFYDRPLPRDLSGLSPIQYRVVAGDYFRTLGIRMLSGRAFTDGDTERAPKVAIVNQELVRRYWDGRDPIGNVISVNPPLEVLPQSVIEEARKAGALPDNYQPDKFAVVGVADDVRYGGLERSAVPLVYVPYLQGSEGTTTMFLAVRSTGDPLALTGAIKEQIGQVDRDQPVTGIQTMETRVAASVAQRRVQMNVLALFAAMAVLLAAIGIYGVMSYSVTQRSRELGIRLALGAARHDVTRLVLRQGFTMVAIGIGLGIAGALLVTRVLRTLLFSVSATDPVVFGSIVLLLSATALFATYLPARRAARLDPWMMLRGE
jgi:putative ABC transport system permease protein